MLLIFIVAGVISCSGGGGSDDYVPQRPSSEETCSDQAYDAYKSCYENSCRNCSGLDCWTCGEECLGVEGSTYNSCCARYGGCSLYSLTISGHVKAEDGTPIPDVTMTSGTWEVPSTDADGFYKIAGITSATVKPVKSGHCFEPYTRYYAPVTTENQTFTDQDYISVSACYAISGTITRWDGHPLYNISVELSGQRTATTATDVYGKYIFDDLHAGLYTVTPGMSGAAPLNRSVTLDVSDVTDQDFVITGPAIMGRVAIVDGSGVPDVNISVDAGVPSTVTDTNGSYVFPDLVQGTYTITPSSGCSAYTFDKPFITVNVDSLVTDQNFTVSMTPFNITGKVETVDGVLSDATLSRSGTGVTTATTDGGGNYRFEDVNDSLSYTITPSAQRYAFIPKNRIVQACNMQGGGQDFNATKTWEKHYPDLRSMSIPTHALDTTSDNGYAVTGYTKASYSGLYQDAVVLKLDSAGEIVWQKRYGNQNNSSRGSSIHQTSDGGYIVGGIRKYGEYSVGDWDEIWMMKLDSNGNMQWQKSYEGFNFLRTMQLTSDGGYILSVYKSVSNHVVSYMLLRLNSDGSILWKKPHNVADIRETSDGGYIAADGNVLKLDSDGNVVWYKKYGPSGDSISSILETTDAGYLAAGTTSSFGAGSSDLLVAKLDTAGNVLWQKAYGGTGSEYGLTPIKETTDGSFILTALTNSFGVHEKTWLLRLNSGGNLLLQKILPRICCSSNALQETSDGGYIIYNGLASVFRTDSQGDMHFCSLFDAQVTDATVTDTNITGEDATVWVAESNTTVSDSLMQQQNSSIGVNQICPRE